MPSCILVADGAAEGADMTLGMCNWECMDLLCIAVELRADTGDLVGPVCTTTGRRTPMAIPDLVRCIKALKLCTRQNCTETTARISGVSTWRCPWVEGPACVPCQQRDLLPDRQSPGQEY